MAEGRSLVPAEAIPLLTIGIPTWNRSMWLAQNLAQLASEMATVDGDLVELLVSDNCSPDDTQQVVENAKLSGLPVRYVRNSTNVGWGRNFAQSFELARGKYVLLLGDDDLLVDGSLKLILSLLSKEDYGVILLRPYGFDNDFRREYPGSRGAERVFRDANQFLVAIGPLITLTSSCVLRKSLNAAGDHKQFSDGDLGALALALRAALAAPANLLIDKYIVASKRQNSFSYNYSEVFVGEFWRIMDAHVRVGLRPDAIRTIERNMMLSYYPFYLFDLRVHRRSDPKVALKHFESRFKGRALFTFWLMPILRWPRPLAIAWGAAATLIGRAIAGDLRRGIRFAWNRLAYRVGGRAPVVSR